MLRNARCCCRQRQSEASASYTQSEHITGKLSQAAEATVRRQSGTTYAMPQLTMWCTHGGDRRAHVEGRRDMRTVLDTALQKPLTCCHVKLLYHTHSSCTV